MLNSFFAISHVLKNSFINSGLEASWRLVHRNSRVCYCIEGRCRLSVSMFRRESKYDFCRAASKLLSSLNVYALGGLFDTIIRAIACLGYFQSKIWSLNMLALWGFKYCLWKREEPSSAIVETCLFVRFWLSMKQCCNPNVANGFSLVQDCRGQSFNLSFIPGLDVCRYPAMHLEDLESWFHQEEPPQTYGRCFRKSPVTWCRAVLMPYRQGLLNRRAAHSSSWVGSPLRRRVPVCLTRIC